MLFSCIDPAVKSRILSVCVHDIDACSFGDAEKGFEGVKASRCYLPEDGNFSFIFSSGEALKTFFERLITG